MLTEVEQIVKLMSSIFEQVGVEYMIGGSVASGVHGVFRYTNDIDIVADINPSHIPALKKSLIDYYADEEMMHEAAERRSSFSIIYLPLMIKVDVFVKPQDDWTNEIWKRRQVVPISSDGSLHAPLPSVEDAILQKLKWFRLGGGVSDRQWSDILGMLRAQAASIDRAYLRKWAAHLGLTDILEKATEAASDL